MSEADIGGTTAVRVMPWPDPVLDTIGHDPRSWYAETFWLPTLGPTSLLLLRHLADRFEQAPQGIDLPVTDTAVALGLGPRGGPSSPLMKSLQRLQQFDLACSDGETQIAVRRALPPIHRRHVKRLPAGLQAQHAEWIADQSNPVDLARRRARRFALTLLAQGEPLDTVERSLHAGGFHPAVAHEAVRWAREQAVIEDESMLQEHETALPAVVPRR